MLWDAQHKISWRVLIFFQKLLRAFSSQRFPLQNFMLIPVSLQKNIILNHQSQLKILEREVRPAVSMIPSWPCQMNRMLLVWILVLYNVYPCPLCRQSQWRHQGMMKSSGWNTTWHSRPGLCRASALLGITRSSLHTCVQVLQLFCAPVPCSRPA